MFILFVALLVLAAPFSVSAVGTPTTIPFGGITTSLPSTSAFTVGQLITQISDVQNFAFYVLNTGSSATASASIAPWSGTSAGSAIATVSVTVPSSSTFSAVTATFSNVNLDPTLTYLISFGFPTSGSVQFVVATAPTSGGAAGGYVEYVSGVWNAGAAKDVVFGIYTQNLLYVNAATNYAQGPGSAGWGCMISTSYTAVQVDWKSLLVNTGFHTYSTTSVVTGFASSCISGVFAPYATTAGCYWEWAYGSIDLTGTHYAVSDSFVTEGWGETGGETYSSSNQVVSVSGTGDCGYTLTVRAYAAGEAGAFITGGYHLQLTRLN